MVSFKIDLPNDSWSFSDILAELPQPSAAAVAVPLRRPFSNDERHEQRNRSIAGAGKPFRISVRDDDWLANDDWSDKSIYIEDVTGRELIRAGTRFAVRDLDFSDSEGSDVSEYERCQIAASSLFMRKQHVEEEVLYELDTEYDLKYMVEVRNELTDLEARHNNEILQTNANLSRLDELIRSKHDVDRKLDKQYERKIAELLDEHLSAIQRDHEHKSQIAERKIRDDAALQETKRRERQLAEERLREQRAKEETEAKLKSAKQAESDRAAVQAALKEATDGNAAISIQKTVVYSEQHKIDNSTKKEDTRILKRTGMSGIKVYSANEALEAEAKRLKLLNDIPENAILAKEFGKYERQIGKSVSKLIPTVDSVQARAQELSRLLNGQDCSQSISRYLFAKKVVSLCRERNTKDDSFQKTAFACGYVVLLVGSQIPQVMDYVLAEFHRMCIYTVPKHFQLLEVASRASYLKMVGYQEENGKFEQNSTYWAALSGYVKLYAAIVQTEIPGISNPHGLAEGWRWLARLLNTLPANTVTAIALEAFLKMAGYALYRRYRSQFLKIIGVISDKFLPELRAKGSKVQAEYLTSLELLIKERSYLHEPEGSRLAAELLSNRFAL